MTKETSIDCCGFRTGPCSVNRCAHILRVLTRDPADSNATRFFLPVLLGVESCEHSARSGGCCQGLQATSFGVRWQASATPLGSLVSNSAIPSAVATTF